MRPLDREQRTEGDAETTAGVEPPAGASAPLDVATRSRARHELARRRLSRRAVEAAIWGMPLVAVDAIRQAYLRDAGAGYHDLLHWTGAADWRGGDLPPGQRASYALLFLQPARGAATVELPGAEDLDVRLQIVDAWNVPVLDATGGAGDAASATRFLLRPPGHAEEIPAHCTPVPLPTNNAYALLRVTPRSDDEEARARVRRYLESLRVQAGDGAEAPATTRLVELDVQRFDASLPRDVRFYESLARMVGEEPVLERDRAIMGQLRSLGIGKELAFAPDAEMRLLLDEAIAEACALLSEDFATSGILWWRDRQWRSLVDECVATTRTTFDVPGRHLLLDERATTWFATVGPASASGDDALRVKTHVDATGTRLAGERSYRLHLPARIPARQGWSVAVRDADTAGCLRASPVVALSSELPSLDRNADGSIDLHFAPRPAEGRAGNWIATVPGCEWFVVFAFHGAEKEALERSWTLDDLTPSAD